VPDAGTYWRFLAKYAGFNNNQVRVAIRLLQILRMVRALVNERGAMTMLFDCGMFDINGVQ
jgi:hypothetical protein